VRSERLVGLFGSANSDHKTRLRQFCSEQPFALQFPSGRETVLASR
jgi:hypothetical protein